MTTAPLTLAKLAIQCIANCLSDETRGQIFRDKETTAAAAVLTSIITSAQVAEQIVSASPVMGQLQICVIGRSTQPDNKKKQIVLWNSIEETRATIHRGAIECLNEYSAKEPARYNRSSMETDSPVDNLTRVGISRLVQANEELELTPLTEQQPNASVTTTPTQERLSPPEPFPNADHPFIITRTTASDVAFKILSGSGYYTHMSGTVQDWPKSYGELYCKHVTLILQRIYETEKSLSKMPSMRYENLLPDHLIRKPVRIEGIAECSKQERGRIPQNGSFIIDLSQRKGTQKHLAFAAICVAYERIYRESQRKHAAKSVLEAFRREGETEIGCNRFRERGSNITVKICDRTSEGSCLQGNVEQESNMRPNHVSLLQDIDGVCSAMQYNYSDYSLDNSANLHC